LGAYRRFSYGLFFGIALKEVLGQPEEAVVIFK